MKNLFLTGVAATSLVLASCSSNKPNVFTQGKQAQAQRAEFLKMKGDWDIASVDYDKQYKIKPFDEGADIQCFVGSHWHLIPNNYSGSYTLSGGGDCPSVVQPIKIDMTADHVLTFKKLQDGMKAKMVTAGYALQLVNQTADQFSLQQQVPFNGSTITVTYNFIRSAMTNTKNK